MNLEKQEELLRENIMNFVKRDVMTSNGISLDVIKEVENIYINIASETGDMGSCVLGNGIKVNGEFAIVTYAQGSIGLERIQSKVIPMLEMLYPDLEFEYAWGNMD